MLNLEDEHDDCRQCLLTIVARGSAIITELCRLVELVPEPFLAERRSLISKQEVTLLSEIICNFSYFKNAEEFETKIENNSELKRIDEQFCDEYLDILTRFYLTFEAVHRQANELNSFIQDLEDDIFIGQSLDSILADHENRQLISEAYFQLGYMLLLVDKSFDGDLRERLIVSYYRYSAYRSSPDTSIDETCSLMRVTGYRCCQQKTYSATRGSSSQIVRPVGYPESYFARVSIDQAVINSLIAKLQAVDIYNQLAVVFPSPEHRSIGLSQQASILYVLLYFCPNILKTQRSRMREITDKFFSDNWIIHLFMGECVNLLDVWEPYRAARESLVQIHEIESVRGLTSQMLVRFNRNAKQMSEYLKEGWMQQETFIANNKHILNCIRDSNMILKWFLLHTRTQPSLQTNKLIKMLTLVVTESQPDSRRLCDFLQNLCLLERKVGLMFDKVISLRETKIDESKARALDTLTELVSIFNDTRPMRWVKVGANQGLAKILEQVCLHLTQLESKPGSANDSSRSRDIVVRLINRIESARESYLDGKSLQVVQLFMDTKESLVELLRYLDLNNSFKLILCSVGDFSYGWTLMDEVFTQPIQLIIRDNPENMSAFEAVIAKLTSTFETQLVRIQQLDAKTDLISVSQYYSSKLVAYIRKVLQVIPATIMELISAIIESQASNRLTSGSLPSRIHLDQLRDYSMADQRLKMLDLTNKISHYARGIMAMPNTSIGLMRIDSKRTLEEGLKRELGNEITKRINEAFILRPMSASSHQPNPSENLLNRLTQLSAVLNSYKSSFTYIQDFLSIYGQKMWQDELGRIVRVSVEQATASLTAEFADMSLRNGDDLVETRSVISMVASQARSAVTRSFHSKTGSVGKTQPAQVDDSGFMMRIIKELLQITDPRETIYDDQSNVWFDKLRQQQVMDSTRLLKLIGSSLGIAGLNGLDRLCSTMLMGKLECLNTLFISKRPQKQRQQCNTILQLFDILSQVRSHKWPLMDTGDNGGGGGNSLKHLILAIFFVALNQRSSTIVVGPSTSSSTGTAQAQHNKCLIDHLLLVGQLQILRQNIQRVLATGSRYEARHLHCCLVALNSALLATIRSGKRSPSQRKAANLEAAGPGNEDNEEEEEEEEEDLEAHNNRRARSSASLDESQLVFELANYLEWIGLSDPLSKTYTLALQRSRLGWAANSVDHHEQQQQQQQQQQPLYGSAAANEQPRRDIAGDHLNALVNHTILEHHGTRFHSSLSSFSNQTLRRRCSSTNAPRQQQQPLSVLDGGYPNKVDGGPLYAGIVTVLNHFQTDIVV